MVFILRIFFPSLPRCSRQATFHAIEQYLCNHAAVLSAVVSEKLTTIDISPEVTNSGEQLLQILFCLEFLCQNNSYHSSSSQDALHVTGFEQTLFSIHGVRELLLLFLHHSLLSMDQSSIQRALLGARFLYPVDSLYFSLFLLRWTAGRLHSMEATCAAQLVSGATYAAITACLDSPRRASRAFITTSIGERGLTLPLKFLLSNPSIRSFFVQEMKDTDKTFEVQMEFGSVVLMIDGHQVKCCPAQALLLLMFEERDQLLENEFFARSPLPPSNTHQILKTLPCIHKHGVIELPSLLTDLELESIFSIHLFRKETKENEDPLINQETL